MWALGSLSRLVLEDPAAYGVVAKDPKCLSQLVKAMGDPEIEVRLSSSGLLRNVTNISDESVCNSLIEKDCLTTCCELIKRFAKVCADLTLNRISNLPQQLPQPGGEDKDEHTTEEEWNILVNVFSLFTNLW